MLKKVALVSGIIVLSFFLPRINGFTNAQTDQTISKIRVVTVKIVADEEFRDFWGPKYNWKDYTGEIVGAASEVLEREFGVKLVVREFEEWNSDNRLWADDNGLMGIDALMAELVREIRPGDEDIVIAFTGQGNLTEAGGAVFVRYILVEDLLVSYNWWRKLYKEKLPKIEYNYMSWSTRVMRLAQFLTHGPHYLITATLLHELGHLFGARDIEEELVMKWESRLHSR